MVNKQYEALQKTPDQKLEEIKKRERNVKERENQAEAREKKLAYQNNLSQQDEKNTYGAKQNAQWLISELTAELSKSSSELSSTKDLLNTSNAVIQKIAALCNLTAEQIKKNPDLILSKIKQVDTTQANQIIKKQDEYNNNLITKSSNLIKQSSTKLPDLTEILKKSGEQSTSSKPIDINSIRQLNPKKSDDTNAIDECQLLKILNKLVTNGNMFVTNILAELYDEENKSFWEKAINDDSNIVKKDKTLFDNFKDDIEAQSFNLLANIYSLIHVLNNKYINNNNDISFTPAEMLFDKYINDYSKEPILIHDNKKIIYINKSYIISNNFKQLIIMLIEDEIYKPINDKIQISKNFSSQIKLNNDIFNQFKNNIKINTSKSIVIARLNYTIDNNLLDNLLNNDSSIQDKKTISLK